MSELLVIGVVALIVIGPKQLPEVAKVIGRLLGELRQASRDLSGGLLEVKNEVQTSIEETKQDIMNQGRKMAESIIEDEPDQPHHDHDHDYDHDHDHEDEPADHGKSE